MVVEKRVNVWVLVDSEKQVIKDNAQKIKNYLVKNFNCNTCTEFFEDHCTEDDFIDFSRNCLPFLECASEYMTENDYTLLGIEIDKIIKDIKSNITKKSFDDNDSIIDFIVNKYGDFDALIQKIIDCGDEQFINKLLNE